MREIDVGLITETVSEAVRRAYYCLAEDVLDKLKEAAWSEKSETGREVLNQILNNAGIAAGRRCLSARTAARRWSFSNSVRMST